MVNCSSSVEVFYDLRALHRRRPSVLGLSRLLYQIAVTYHVIRKILLQPQEGLRASQHPRRQPQGTPNLGNMLGMGA